MYLLKMINALHVNYIFFFKKRFYLLLKEGREKERERNIGVWWGPDPQPRHCPDWELNQQPFSSQAGTESTEPHQPRQAFFLFLLYILV